MIVTIPDAITAFRFIFPTQMIAEAHGRTRTDDLRFTKPLLYPAELRRLMTNQERLDSFPHNQTYQKEWDDILLR